MKKKTEKKPICLKQFLVTSERNDRGCRQFAYILNTCAATARKEFEAVTGLKPEFCCQSAESEFTKEDLNTHDFWKEKRNWTVLQEKPQKMSKSAENYFKTKELAEKVQTAKAKLKISDWENVTEKQLKQLNEILGK